MATYLLIAVPETADANQVEDYVLGRGYRSTKLSQEQFDDIIASVDFAREADRQALKSMDPKEDAADIEAVNICLNQHEELVNELNELNQGA